MEFKDYYAALGVARDASADEIKQAYRKLARKFHPDVSKLPDAEARFKEINEANEVLKDPEKRAVYDRVGQGGHAGQAFSPPPGWNAGYEFSGRGAVREDGAPGGFQEFGATGDGFGGGFADDREASDFFEALFGRAARRAGGARGGAAGQDHHARIQIDLEDAYRGAQRSIVLRMPVASADGTVTLQERTLDVAIPKGIRAGQHLRLAGQGGAAAGGAVAGDLFLEIEFRPHPRFRLDGRDVYFDLPLAPWEAALGARVAAATPDGDVELTIPANSAAGRKLRLKGRGLPGNPAGDLYAVLAIALPPADSERARAAYQAFAAAFDFDPRRPSGR